MIPRAANDPASGCARHRMRAILLVASGAELCSVQCDPSVLCRQRLEAEATSIRTMREVPSSASCTPTSRSP